MAESFGIDSAWNATKSTRSIENDDLVAWWREQAEEEIARTVPKVAEYGATDLVTIGRSLAIAMHRTVTDAEAAELGVFFYAQGKLARWLDAITTGRAVSDDTLFDLGVYVRMVQRIREVGHWG